jgi:hypothetical protein
MALLMLAAQVHTWAARDIPSFQGPFSLKLLGSSASVLPV